MKQLLFLLLFPCLCMAQYTGNAGQKITLGEQTTADGLVYRGRLADTANLLTNKLDTSVYIVLDTGTQAMWYYRASTTPKWTRLVDSLNNMQGQLSLTTKVTGTLPVANGGTGSATQNFVDLTTTQNSIGGAKTFTSAVTATKLNVTDSIQSNSGIYKINSSTLGLNVDNTTPFRITNSGNWGIYNDNPQNLLSTFSSSARGGVISGAYPILMFNEVNKSKFVFGLDENEGYLWGMTNVKLIIATNNTEKMRIETNGNVGIGTASPTEKLHVDGTGRFTGSITSTAVNSIISTGGSSILSSQYTGTNGNWFTFQNGGGVHYVGIDNSAGTDFGATAYSMLFYTPSTRNIEFLSPAGKRMIIASGGAVTINNLANASNPVNVQVDVNGTLVRTSSINIKEDVQNLPYGLNEIMLLQPSKFSYIDKYKYGEGYDIGFIAEDVINVIPEAVGTGVESDVFMDSVKLIPILTKAIQEQNALIKALEQRILILENK